MTHLVLRLVAPQGQARIVVDSLRAVARRARQDHSCRASDAYTSVEDQDHLVLEQDWRAESDLSRYIRSDDFTQILALIDMAAEVPHFELQNIGETRGLEYVKEVRRSASASGHISGEKT